MFTRVILAAGVAALAISAPAAAQPERNKAERAERQENRAERQKAVRAERAPRAERQQPRVERQAQRVERQQPRIERQAQRERQQPRMERQAQRIERQQPRMERQAQRIERQQPRMERQAQRIERQQPRIERQAQRIERQQPRIERQAQRIERQQPRIERQAQRIDRQQVRQQRIDRTDARMADRQLIRENQAARTQGRIERQALQNDRQQLRAERQILTNRAVAERWGRIDDRRATRQALRTTRFGRLDNRIVTDYIEPVRVRSFIGSPVRTVAAYTTLAAVPTTVSYLYPDTDDYYYRYGGGYVYRVERDNDLIDWVLPLLAGGFMPGQYLPNYYMSSPNYYMNSYAPAAYGFNSFYPDYGNDCHRYGNGVVYEVDCYTGLVEDVIPLYAGGYGVGQMLPSSYSYYNVPYQYRDVYYDTDDYGYWYAPGAIYQYDPSTSLITSVAALLSPGFSVGQPLPMGYNTYNVPYAYRQTYYDTPNAWYRYNNGYIYQVDPTTQLVTAIVASILT